jgi:hypothetical protein
MTRLWPLVEARNPHLLYLWLLVLYVLSEVDLGVTFFPFVILAKSSSFTIPMAHFDLGELVHTWLIEQDLGGSLLDGATNSSISEGVSELRGALAPSKVDLGLGGGGRGAINVFC